MLDLFQHFFCLYVWLESLFKKNIFNVRLQNY